MADYFRPLVQIDPARPEGAMSLAGGWGWFSHVEVLSRARAAKVISAADLPKSALDALTTTRAPIAGLALDRPRVMGILNATPDSFSDGGRHADPQVAVEAGMAMRAAGVDMLDVGGESTRPGADTVPEGEEIDRIVPVIAGLRAAGTGAISIDTRKAAVAEAAVGAGANLVNDVAALTFDPALAPFCAARELPVCVMHAQGDPATMQRDPRYDDVVLDVYDYLADRIAALEAQGIARHNIIADPGIGFGKTLEHNLALLARLSLFHSLGVPILLGASRKRFIGTIGGGEAGADRAPGSIAVALAALSHGIQFLRVHDVAQTIQAIALYRAAMAGKQI
ncbi:MULTISPECIES: dihydropteroate synthase [Sulfitobacter]|uniref:Dihydropteroate synthase n=1 Tax=Sulfitobacter dubius TaxID=218673 RepID=A0ABY3ZHX6_9RHOB|nr:dihydropteroate synthase [Sulfitobacter dubius]UOA14271.1 Dihydropteroate synthase [Sulfitobacter dubius]WOI30238.1 dihydropteroate synthase [Sulfitobacter dubius]